MVTVTVSTPSNSIVGEESRCGSYRHHHALRPNVHLGGILPHATQPYTLAAASRFSQLISALFFAPNT
ncbi:MAG: hypothetical protein KatS3mg055_2828 [Chloroflexus sp.]|nr:MAG: hypothetical protein KatS3mg055_2828 [Chloroflexus sp.]